MPDTKAARDATPEELLPAALCPVDRLPRRTRNKICIGIIALGGLNFLIYTLTYASLGGDAHNGGRKSESLADGSTRTVYYVSGHYIRNINGEDREVSRAAWVYSYLHSMLVLLTSGAMIISMLVLARPDILATMRDGWISGQTFITAFGGVVGMATLLTVFVFARNFLRELG